MSTLAEYNNNPGNLRPPKDVKYDGQIGVDDKGFAIFENAEYGRRALLNDINIKLKRGLNTPDKFLDVYAPRGNENPEEARDNYRIFLAQTLGLKSTAEPFPKDSAERIAEAISKFEGGTWGKPPAQPSEETEQGGDAQPPAPTLGQKAEQLLKDTGAVAAQAAEEYPTAARAGFDVAGALAGRKLSTMGEAARRDIAAQAARTPAAAAPPPATPAQVAPVTPPEPPSRKVPGSSGAANWTRVMGQDIPHVIAESAESMRASDPRGGQALINRDIEAMRRIREMGLGGYQLSGSGSSQLMLPPEAAAARPAPPPPPPPAPPPPPPKAPLSARISRGVNIGARAMPGAFGVLGGLGAAELGQEAYGRVQSGDIPGAMIAGAGALGSAASLMPFPQTRVGGPALATISPLTLYLYDKAKSRAVSQAKGYGALAAGRKLPTPSIYQGYGSP